MVAKYFDTLVLLVLFFFSCTSFGESRFDLGISQKEIAAYFERTYDKEGANVLIDEEWITDSRREIETRNRIGLVSDAIMAGQDVDYLKEYGLIRNGKNTYSVAIKNDYNWLTVSTLFFPLKFEDDYEKIYLALAKRGFDRADLQELEFYLKNNSFFNSLNEASKDFQRNNSLTYITKYKAAKTPSEKSRVFFEWTKKTRLFKDDFEYRWALNLYSRFDDRAKMILCSFLSESISDLSLMDDGITMDKFELHLRNYISTFDKQVNNVD